MVERIPQTFIKGLIEKSDIVEIIGRRVEIKKAGKEYRGRCPFHDGGKEKTPSFYVNQEKGLYYCFACTAKGNSLSFLMDYEHLSYPEAIE